MPAGILMARKLHAPGHPELSECSLSPRDQARFSLLPLRGGPEISVTVSFVARPHPIEGGVAEAVSNPLWDTEHSASRPSGHAFGSNGLRPQGCPP